MAQARRQFADDFKREAVALLVSGVGHFPSNLGWPNSDTAGVSHSASTPMVERRMMQHTAAVHATGKVA